MNSAIRISSRAVQAGPVSGSGLSEMPIISSAHELRQPVIMGIQFSFRPLGGGAMKEQVDELLKEVAADLAQHGFDDQFLARSISRFKELHVQTEDDRNQLMAGGLRLFDYLLAHAPGTAAEAIQTERQILQTAFDRWYGRPDTAYRVTNRIVSDLVAALQQRGPCGELVERALAELEIVPCDGSPQDELVKMGGKLRIYAVRAAYDTLVLGNGLEPDSPVTILAAQIGEAAQKGVLGTGLILRMSEHFRAQPGDTAEVRRVTAWLLKLLLGTGLFLNPEAAPAFEPLHNRILELLRAEVPEAPSAAGPFESILDRYRAVVERDGFTEFSFREAMTELSEVPAENAPDAEARLLAYRRFLDFAASRAPAESAQIIRTVQSSIERESNAAQSAEAPFSPEQMRSHCSEIVDRLKGELEAGESPGPAYMKAITAVRELGGRIPEDQGEDAARVLLDTLPQLMSLLAPYVPKGEELKVQQAAALMSIGTRQLDVSSSGDATAQAVFGESVNEELARFSQLLDTDSLPEKAAGTPHIRQFVELLVPFAQRLERLYLRIEAATQDGAEIARMASKVRDYLPLVGAAYTEEQYFRHQRSTLRRLALDLRQFERRHLLMVVAPPFPTNPVTADANAVFFSGSTDVQRVVEKACGILHMGLARPHGVENETHGRWQQLRSSGVAVFDYSAYNPREADPPGPLPRSRQAEARILRAAGPIAQVAYETGWAYVTGTPAIVVARKGHRIPFDIDVEPVYMHGDGQDAERLAAALQASIYGAQHGIAANCLGQTVDELRRSAGQYGSEIQALVSSLTDLGDATRVRLALAAAVDRIDGAKPLLVIPSFPGTYPAAGTPRLFHVAAFREWGKTAQAETEKACKRAGVEYRIGYERLNPDVIRTIWTDLCESSFVVADITNLNPNAVLELAIAHALGKRTLVLTQNAEPHSYLPAIQKVRTHSYDPVHGRVALAGLLDGFLAQVDSGDRLHRSESGRGGRRDASQNA